MNIQLLTILIKDDKERLGKTVDVFDDEISDLIEAAALDLLKRNAIQSSQLEGTTIDPLIKRAIMTYVKAYFREPDNREQLIADYNEQKATLMMTTGYTDWGGVNG